VSRRRKCPDVKDLTRIVERLGVEMRSNQPKVSKPEFLMTLHERYDDAITIEQLRYCVDEWAWPKARKAMQGLDAEAKGLVEARQLMLPMKLGHLKVPKALPIVVKGVPETVTAVFANIEQGDAYTASLQKNSVACIRKLTTWQSAWEPARKVMVEHIEEGWDFGRALEYIAEQDGDGMVPVRQDDSDEDEDDD
jgi:hypothetical protein